MRSACVEARIKGPAARGLSRITSLLHGGCWVLCALLRQWIYYAALKKKPPKVIKYTSSKYRVHSLYMYAACVRWIAYPYVHSACIRNAGLINRSTEPSAVAFILFYFFTPHTCKGEIRIAFSEFSIGLHCLCYDPILKPDRL